MFQIVAFDPRAHLGRLMVESQAPTAEDAQALATGGAAYCAVGADGAVHAVAGLTEQWSGRAVAWAMIGDGARKSFKEVHRAVLAFLANDQHRRIELYVRADFPAAARWAEHLGFVRETPEPMAGFGPGGEACYLYAKVRNA